MNFDHEERTWRERATHNFISLVFFCRCVYITHFYTFWHHHTQAHTHSHSLPLTCAVLFHSLPPASIFTSRALLCFFLYATILCLDLLPRHCFHACICNLPWKFQPTHPGMQLEKHSESADLHQVAHFPPFIATYSCIRVRIDTSCHVTSWWKATKGLTCAKTMLALYYNIILIALMSGSRVLPSVHC